METKLVYFCICPWAKLAEFLSNVDAFVPAQIMPTSDRKAALVEFHPLVTEVVSLVSLVEFFKEGLIPNGKENN